MLNLPVLGKSLRSWSRVRGIKPASQQAAQVASHSKHAAEIITSTANDLIKHCVKLRTSAKHREEHGQFLLTGLSLLREAAGCMGGKLHARLLFVSQSGLDLPPDWLTADRVIHVNEAVMKKLSGLESAATIQAIAQLLAPPKVDLIQDCNWATASSTPQKGHSAGQTLPNTRLLRLLALDGVQDPGNLGTLIRSALAFGWDAVWLLPNCCDPYNEKAVRASRGAVLRTVISGGTLDQLQKVCTHHGMCLVAAEPDEARSSGSRATKLQPAPAVCLVLGSEGQGISSQVMEVCSPVSIPMAGDMESLNVGVAGSILMFMLSKGGPTELASHLTRLNLDHLWCPGPDSS